MAQLTLKVNLNGAHRMEGGGVIGGTWPSLSLKPPERQCEVLGSGSGQAEGPWWGVAICLEPPSLGLMLPSSSWAPGALLISSSTLWMWGPNLGSGHQQRAREGAPWTLRLALGALAPFLENSLRTRLLVGRGPTTSCAEKNMLTTRVIRGGQSFVSPCVLPSLCPEFPAAAGGLRPRPGQAVVRWTLVREKAGPRPAPDPAFPRRHASPTGLLLTAVVALIYMVAIVYEE